MSSAIPRSAALAVLAACASSALAAPASAQDLFEPSKSPLEVAFQPQSGDPAQTAVPGEFVCEGECPFPDETLLNVGLRRTGQDKFIGDAWARCVVSGGKYKVSLGPWSGRAVARGEYVIDSFMEMARQPAHVYTEIRRKHRFEKDHREHVGTANVIVGGADGAAADSAEVASSLRDMFGKVKQLAEMVALMVSKKPAPSPEERQKWRAERMAALTEISSQLKGWVPERIGILGEEHVGYVELLISAVNHQMRYWEKDPESRRVASYGEQAAKLMADFEAVPLPGQKLAPLPGGDGEKKKDGD